VRLFLLPQLIFPPLSPSPATRLSPAGRRHSFPTSLAYAVCHSRRLSRAAGVAHRASRVAKTRTRRASSEVSRMACRRWEAVVEEDMCGKDGDETMLAEARVGGGGGAMLPAAAREEEKEDGGRS